MFKIEKEEYINKTFRLEKNMVNQMELLCADRNISMNKLVARCIEYALENLEENLEQSQ